MSNDLDQEAARRVVKTLRLALAGESMHIGMVAVRETFVWLACIAANDKAGAKELADELREQLHRQIDSEFEFYSVQRGKCLNQPAGRA